MHRAIYGKGARWQQEPAVHILILLEIFLPPSGFAKKSLDIRCM
jgi:hypothetical protein